MRARSPLGILFLTVFLDLLGFGLVIPFVTKFVEHYWLRDSPGSPYVDRIATGLSASFSLAQLLAAPLWGALSDRVGRRPVLLATIPLMAFSYLLFGLAADERVNAAVFGTGPGSGHAVVAALFVSRVLSGLFAANISTAFAYVADVTTPENRSRGLGAIGAAFGLGFVVGPALGGFLFAHFGRGAPGFAAAGLGIVNTVWAAMRLPESLPPERRGRAPKAHVAERLVQSLREPVLGRLLVLSFVVTFAFAHMEQSLALYLGDRADRGGRAWLEDKIGYFYAFIGVVIAFTQGWLLRKLARRHPERSLVLAGWACLGMGLVGLGIFGRSAWPLAALGVAGAFVALGNGLSNPSLNSLISRSAPETAQGGVFGTTQAVGSLARFAGPISAGWVSDFFGRAVPMYVAAAGTTVAFALLAGPWGQVRTSEAPAPGEP
ncbi:MAG TPA: MFS transporter [Planctomycetota bacterium]|nr:MFS transporter [Planctomycetota bacterium]